MITLNIHGCTNLRAKAWNHGSTNAVDILVKQESGDELELCLYVRDGYTRAFEIAKAINGVGKRPSPYDPELDGLSLRGMRVEVFEHGGLPFLADLVEVLPDEDERAHAEAKLLAQGSCRVGGGASPLYTLTRVDQ
jgi:hypothetical protein